MESATFHTVTTVFHFIMVRLQHDATEKLSLAAVASDRDMPNGPINIVGNNFQAKQKLLLRLRTSTDCNINKETADDKFAEIMVGPQLKEYIVNTSYHKMAEDLSLQEISKQENEHQQWRITAPAHVQTKDLDLDQSLTINGWVCLFQQTIFPPFPAQRFLDYDEIVYFT